MSEVTDDKGPGRGRGKWTEKGAQATQQNDIDELKALVAEMAARLDEVESEMGMGTPADGGDQGTGDTTGDTGTV